MNFGKKDQPRQYDNQVEYKKGEPFNPRTMVLLYSRSIPFGKNKGQTLEWVMENDNKYYQWMQSKCLITSWGLSATKQVDTGTKPDKEQVLYLVDDYGYKWLNLYLVEEPGVASEWL